jgi:hypothetical protein
MIAFMKNYSLENIKNKFFILYTLNVTDIMFTIILLNTGFYTEANTLMSVVPQSLLTSFLLKIVLPALLLVFIYFRMQNATDHQLKQSNFFINANIILYTFINMFHIVCFSILPLFI